MNEFRLRLGNTLYFCSETFEDDLMEAVSLGFDTIDLNIANTWYNEELELSYYSRLDEGIDKIIASGIKVNGIHVSFGPRWDISEPNEEKRLSAVKKTVEIFERTDRLGPYCYIIHPSFEPIADEIRGEHIEALKRSAALLAKATDRLICLETLPRSCLMNTSDEARMIIDEISLPNVKICIDVNHFLYEKSEDAILALGERIATTHISDYDFKDECHLLPGQGSIDWMRLISCFEKIGYQGVFNYEAKVAFSLVKNNYVELFDKYNAKKVK